MTVKKDKRQQPGKANSVEAIGEELSDKELKGITGGATKLGKAKTLQEDTVSKLQEATNSKDVMTTPTGRA